MAARKSSPGKFGKPKKGIRCKPQKGRTKKFYEGKITSLSKAHRHIEKSPHGHTTVAKHLKTKILSAIQRSRKQAGK